MELKEFQVKKLLEENKELRDELVEKDKRYYRLAEFCEEMKAKYEQKIKELTEENEGLRVKTDILDEEYTKIAKSFYKEGVNDMKERIETLFPTDKKFTTISLFTLAQIAKELKGE